MEKLTNYVKASFAEMKKVTWPTRDEVYKHTITVIVICAFTAVFLGTLDYVFTLGLENFLLKK